MATPNISPMQRDLVLTRTFDAPRELVYRAWTDPKHLARWWGPAGWTNPVCEIDLRAGGTWRIVMRAPDGGEYPCGGVYREIIESKKLAFTNNAFDANDKMLLEGFTTVTLQDLGGKTELTLETRATGLVPYADMMLAGMEAGWSQSLDRLRDALPILESR